MRLWLVLIGVALSAVAFSKGAHAQNYPWCAYYGGVGGGGTNCGFMTFQQCMTSASGIGGSCEPNTQYVPPPGPHAPAQKNSDER
jgi:hypothetical protein